MKKGSKGLDVVKLQTQLYRRGYDKIIIDGEYGKLTESIVKDFQRSNRLISDGWAGGRTIGRLNSLTKDDWLSLFIHCTASPDGVLFTGQEVSDYHTENKGWSRPGYSDIIEHDGELFNAREFDSDDMIGEWEYTFGVKGSTMMNRNSRHICYVGGLDDNGKPADTRTKEQKKTMETYIKYMLLRNPKLIIAGHYNVQKKACPCFDVEDWLKSIGIKESNIAMWGIKYSI